MIEALQCELMSPEETQEGKNTCHLAAIRLWHLPIYREGLNSLT